MSKKGKHIICPRCGEEGLLIQKPTVTKGHKYLKWYVAHYLPNNISKHGKRVNRIRWCYLNKKQLEKLNVTQKRKNRYTKQTENKAPLEPRAGFEPATLALPSASFAGRLLKNGYYPK